jgi:hypothetical protein
MFFGPVRAFACENAAGCDLIRFQRSELLFGDLIPHCSGTRVLVAQLAKYADLGVQRVRQPCFIP